MYVYEFIHVALEVRYDLYISMFVIYAVFELTYCDWSTIVNGVGPEAFHSSFDDD